MGKKGNGFNVFESYVAAGLSSQSTTSADNEPIPLPDSMRTSTLIEQIGKDHQWSEDQIDTDIITLENNRLYYVKDLRELSKSSWKAIELLPLVKDLLRNALDPTRKLKKEKITKKDKKKEKKKYKKEKKMKKKLGEPVTNNDFLLNHKGDEASELFTQGGVISEDPETIRNTLQNLTLNGDHTSSPKEKKKKKTTEKSVSFSENDPTTSNSSSSSSSSSDSDCDEKCTTNVQQITTNKPKVFTGRPIKPVSANRIRVQTLNGNVYETDRFCPHKKVDLNTWGQVLGNSLICTKHNWNFPLEGGGFSTKGRNINPCKVNDW